MGGTETRDRDLFLFLVILKRVSHLSSPQFQTNISSFILPVLIHWVFIIILELSPNYAFSGLLWCLKWLGTCLQYRRPGFCPWIGKIPWKRKWQPTPVFLPGEFHGQRNWWAIVDGVAESDTTEWLVYTHMKTRFFSFAVQIVSALALSHRFIFLLCPVDIIMDFLSTFLLSGPKRSSRFLSYIPAPVMLLLFLVNC